LDHNFGQTYISSWFLRMCNVKVPTGLGGGLLSSVRSGKRFKCSLEVVVSPDDHLLLLFSSQISWEDSGRLITAQWIRTLGVPLTHKSCQCSCIVACTFTGRSGRTRSTPLTRHSSLTLLTRQSSGSRGSNHTGCTDVAIRTRWTPRTSFSIFAVNSVISSRSFVSWRSCWTRQAL
jgi:hypothetical protein